jgi:hypothetical protein
MVGAFLSACILIMYTTMGVAVGHALDRMTSISILSPHNGDTVADTFDISYEILNAPKGNHAHVYLDGAYQKGFQGKFAHVPKGEHTITVKIADPDHKDAGTATDSVTIKVVE